MWFKLKHELYLAFVGVLMKLAPGSSYMLFAGEQSSTQLCRYMARAGCRKVLVVTDKPLVELGICGRAIAGFEGTEVETVLFDGVLPDPTFQIVDEGLQALQANACDSILAIGGGSSIDAAKIISLAGSNPGDPRDYVGFGKIKQAVVPLYAIPTTSGTGSEATAGAVISDTTTHEKSIIADGKLLPGAAALDPSLLVGLPPHITAATGMDALTHAVEAYIGRWDAGDCLEKAATAIPMIFKHLPVAYADGANIEARDAMAHASYMAGQAINQVNVGNVHAIAHQLGGTYGIPHGLANAMVLPHILELSLPAANERLTELARLIGKTSATEFIDAVRKLSAEVGIIPTSDKLQEQDFGPIVERAVNEGAGYPAPHLMNAADVTGILQQLLPAA
jgi:alcohol dehydrogenase